MWDQKRPAKFRNNYNRPHSQNNCEDNTTTKVELPTYLTSYVCPKCKLFYEFHATADGSYVGRIPLVQKCKHTVCGECIRKDVSEKLISCVECNASTELQSCDSKKKMHELFPINFYIFGVLMYYRQNKQKTPNLSFKPSGQIWNQERPGAKCSTASSDSAVTMMSMEKCSQKDCLKDATVNCPDCDESFCDNCATLLHNSAKGLMKHKYKKLLQGISPELTTSCASHKGSILEFHCKNCNVSLCCYCVLLNHKDHEYHQLSQMSKEDVVTVSGLVQEAEALLVKLERAEKKISKYMDQNLPTGSCKNNLNVEISRFFENFHANLQMLEKQMHREAMEYKEMRYHSLVMMRKEVSKSMNSITSLINSAKRAINNDEEVKLDVPSIKEGLREALTTKCHVIQEDNEVVFEHGNAISELQDVCRIKYTNINSFVLVNADDVPSNYDDTFSDISSVSLTPSLLNDASGCSKNTEASDRDDANGGIDTEYLDNWGPSNGKRWSEIPQSSSTNKIKIPFEEMCNVPILKIGDKERVTVTHVNSPESFYVQLIKSTYPLMMLNQQIEQAMPRKQLPVLNPKMLGVYLVQFKTENSSEYDMDWYRARIMHMSIADDKFSVFFIDYGNTAVVPKKWIKPIPDELAKIPPFAFECRIFDIFPNEQEWDHEALSLIVSIVKDIEVLMIILDKSLLRWEVDLITMDGTTSVRDALMFIGAGKHRVQEVYEVKKAKEDMSSFKKPVLYPFSKKFLQYEEAQVIITSVNDPHHLYLNLVDHQGSLNELKENMRAHYTQNTKGFLYAPKKNMPVAVCVSAGSWYRGTLVTTSEEKKQMEVYFVDVGRTSWVDWSDLRKLDEKFMHMQCQAFCVKMMHVKPVNGAWPSEVHQFFMPYIKDKIELKMVVGDVWAAEILEVALFETQLTVHYSVNAKLVRDGFAKSDGHLGTEVEWPQGTTNSSQTSFTMQIMKWAQTEQYETQDSGDEDYSSLIRKEVEVVSVVDPSCIYIRFLMMSPRQSKFFAELQEYYSSVAHQPLSWNSDKVVVKHNNHYHRAIIRGTPTEENGHLYTVELRDIGEIIKTEAKFIYNLEEYFANFPEFVTRCHLANITPAGDSKKWPRLATEFLTEALNTKSKILVTKCGKIDMEICSMPVVMWYTEFVPGGPLQRSKTILHSLNKMLMRNGLALKSRVQLVFPKHEQPKTKVEDVDNSGEDENLVSVVAREVGITDWPLCPPFQHEKYLGVGTYVDDKSYIYFQDNRDKNRFESIQEDVNKFCNKSAYVPYSWEVDDLCLAKYHIDNCWYRAQITKCDPNSFTVIMIDFGNEEVIDNIQDLNHRIIHHDVPSFAYKVCLDNVQPKNNVWSTSDLDLLHGAIVDQKIQVTLVDKTSKPPTANIKCQKVDINQFMLLKSGNLQTRLDKLLVEPEDYDDASSEDVIIIEDDSDEELEYKQRQLPSATPLGELINVLAVNIKSYRMFVLDFGLHSEEKDSVDRLNELAARIIEDGPHQPSLKDMRSGMPCIALFPEDNLFYRGKVQEVLEDKVVVYFVDFGNTETVDIENVRQVKREWVEGYPLDYLIATVPIEAIDPTRNDPLDHYTRMEVVPHVAFASIINFSPLTVKLFKKDRTTEAYQGLLDLGLVKYCDDKQEG